jgi:sulfur dioxygenase
MAALEKEFPERLKRHDHTYPVSAKAGADPLFLQVFDGKPEQGGGGSSTLTYILGDAESGEAVIIDPVLEQAERDMKKLEEMGLTGPYLVLNTHCHADHVTSGSVLRSKLGNLKTAISAASTADADIKLEANQVVTWGKDKKRSLKVLPTPGHTNGCCSFYDADIGCVFTGDALLIGGCGRTDFQEGSAATLYDSVHSQLFTLPEDTLVFPAHDYKGRVRSSVAQEKANNPRLGCGNSKETFMQIMTDLKLNTPAKMHIAVPANLKCGVFEVEK